MRTEQGLLDTKAVAVALGVSKWTIYRLVKSKEIEQHGFRVRKVGRLLRFEVDRAVNIPTNWSYQLSPELEAFVEQSGACSKAIPLEAGGEAQEVVCAQFNEPRDCDYLILFFEFRPE